MEEGNALSFGTKPRGFVDEPDAGGSASTERAFDVVDGEADVVNARSAFGDELADWGVVRACLEQLDQGVAGREARDVRAIGVVEGNVGKLEDVAVEGQDCVEVGDGYADVSDAGAAGSSGSHVGCAGVGALALNINSGVAGERPPGDDERCRMHRR